MKIQVGDIFLDKVTNQRDWGIFPNKTRKYLLPCLKSYGHEFTKRLNNAYKVAVGIGDIIVSNRGYKHEKHIFILLDSDIATTYFTAFLDFIRNHDSYDNDYVYGNIQKTTLHMIIVKLPVKYFKAFETFKMGSYSKMYSQEDIDNYFNVHPIYRRILVKDNRYKIKFAKQLNEFYGTTLKAEDMTGELDFPPTEESEVFNHHLKPKT
jgi:hypothetical protein